MIALRQVMIIHAISCIIIGIWATFIPHGLVASSSEYNHMAHEYIRMYGCLTLSVGMNG